MSSHVLPFSVDKAVILAFDSPELGNFSLVPAEVKDPNRIFVLVNELYVRLTFTLSASQVYLMQELCSFFQINLFHQSFPGGL